MVCEDYLSLNGLRRLSADDTSRYRFKGKCHIYNNLQKLKYHDMLRDNMSQIIKVMFVT